MKRFQQQLEEIKDRIQAIAANPELDPTARLMADSLLLKCLIAEQDFANPQRDAKTRE